MQVDTQTVLPAPPRSASAPILLAVRFPQGYRESAVSCRNPQVVVIRDGRGRDARLREIEEFVQKRLQDIRGLLFADVPRAKAELSKHCTAITLTPEGSTFRITGDWNYSADVRMVPGAQHERIATSASPSRSRHKSFVCYEMCACTVQALIETASPANSRGGGAYGSHRVQSATHFRSLSVTLAFTGNALADDSWSPLVDEQTDRGPPHWLRCGSSLNPTKPHKMDT